MKTHFLPFCRLLTFFFIVNIMACCTSPEKSNDKALREYRVESKSPAQASFETANRRAARELFYRVTDSIELIGEKHPINVIDYDILQKKLIHDEQVVEEAFYGLEPKFKSKGFNFEDLKDAAFVSWYKLRTEQLDPIDELTEEQFISATRHLGVLIISSEPDKAQIEIDNHLMPEPTNSKVWIKSGKCSLRLTKEGYTPVKKIYEIKELEATTVNVTLRKKKNK